MVYYLGKTLRKSWDGLGDDLGEDLEWVSYDLYLFWGRFGMG